MKLLLGKYLFEECDDGGMFMSSFASPHYTKYVLGIIHKFSIKEFLDDVDKYKSDIAFNPSIELNSIERKENGEVHLGLKVYTDDFDIVTDCPDFESKEAFDLYLMLQNKK